MSVGASAELGFAGTASGDIDAMGVLATILRDGTKDDAGMAPDQLRLAAFLRRWVVVGQLPPADHRGRRHHHLVRRYPEPMGQVPACGPVISLIGRGRNRLAASIA